MFTTLKNLIKNKWFHSSTPATAQQSSKEPASPLPSTKGQEEATKLAAYLNQSGETLYKKNEYKLAAEYFYRALELKPNNAWYCQNLAEAVARLNHRKGDQWECEALGKRMDETGKWDVAVRYYRHALKLNPAQVEECQKNQVHNVLPPQEGQVDNPIFIVGCGHSGTSLMLAILGSHPRLHPIPKESAIFLRTDKIVQKTMEEWDTECGKQGKARWIEKTPPHIFQIQRFLAFRPNAKFILMMRDGRDVVCSLKPRIGYAAFEDRLDRWVYDNMAARPYWNHPQLKIVKYEDLITDTERVLQDICQFIDEEYSKEMLEYHKQERHWYSEKIEKPEVIENQKDHQNNRNWQINQPLFDGRNRWVTEMTVSEKTNFMQSPAHALMEELGYASSIQSKDINRQ